MSRGLGDVYKRQVRLRSEPTSGVTIYVASSDTGEGTVSASSLAFTTTNWNADQTVTITGVADNLSDGDQSYAIRLWRITRAQT